MGARRSIGAPLTVGIVLMVLLLALAVGWQVLVWSGSTTPPTDDLATLDWVLLVLGTLFFVLVMIGLVWLCVLLVQEVRLNQRQRAFLDAVTHEMKTPLSSFRLGLDTLGRHELERERREEFIERMQEDLDRLDHTVGQVLAAARAEERQRVPLRKREHVELQGVLEECAAPLLERHRLPADAVRIESRSPVWVRGDRAELGLIFGNLIENAIKYSDSDEPVDVRVEIRSPSEGRVTVEIADRGIGIPPWELRKIFQRFYRVGRGVQRQVAGLGLGLFVVRSMVKRQGGRIVAKSEGAGHGSRFVVTLRADPQEPRRSPLAMPADAGLA
ncbi:MAG: HAMP domain-containing histidine kinase [Deltaproteobacteria bacterium]|jgi:signal transduction histidine kinase|nr:HAMP domain-containing histidine kinase [Deltaproteobacteria bacterium]MBW2383082.1 HAMP domain-containing histidine kinase [Deltaproteobacteria bacterium]MBW2696257.1 HAMP domain-containing histidine kinase [Deltaproteobacteria bacterium]